VSDDLAPLEALPDGQLVAEVLEALQISKSMAYKYLGELQIKPQTHRAKAWLSGAEVELLTAYARHPGARLSAAEALAAVGRGALVVSPAATLPELYEPTPEAADDDREQLEVLALQLQALGAAQELGAPLTSRQARLLLGARHGDDWVTRAGIEAQRLGYNLWQLRRATDDRRGRR
jgi:hypothetical protein